MQNAAGKKTSYSRNERIFKTNETVLTLLFLFKFKESPRRSEDDGASVASGSTVGSSAALSLKDVPSSCPDLSILTVPRLSQSSVLKTLIRLLVVKIKLGSDDSTVKNQATSQINSHKLSVGEGELCRVVNSVVSR